MNVDRNLLIRIYLRPAKAVALQIQWSLPVTRISTWDECRQLCSWWTSKVCSYVIRHFQQTVRSLKTSRPRWTQLTAVVGRVYVGSCLPRRRRRRRLRRWEASGQEADSQVPGRLAHCSGPAGKTFPPAWTLSLGFGHTSQLAPVDDLVAKIPPLEICLC